MVTELDVAALLWEWVFLVAVPFPHPALAVPLSVSVSASMSRAQTPSVLEAPGLAAFPLDLSLHLQSPPLAHVLTLSQQLGRVVLLSLHTLGGGC